MSRSRGCLVIELRPGEWWVAVAYDEYDYEFRSGEKFGPAVSEEAANDMVTCSNPGAYHIIRAADVTDEHRKLLDRLYYNKPRTPAWR